MCAAVEKAGVPNMVWFNYRRVPAISLAKQVIDEGRIGRPFHYRAQYLQDWTIATDVPQGGAALWRLDVDVAGSGVTGDLLAHSIDTAEWLNGPIARVSAATETFVKQRMHAETGMLQPVGIDDACNVPGGFLPTARWARSRARVTRAAAKTSTLSSSRRGRQHRFRSRRPAIPRLLPIADPRRGAKIESHLTGWRKNPRHQFRTSVHEELVGARLHDRIRTHLHQRLGRLSGKPGNRQGKCSPTSAAPSAPKKCATPCSPAPKPSNGSRSSSAQFACWPAPPCLPGATAGSSQQCFLVRLQRASPRRPLHHRRHRKMIRRVTPVAVGRIDRCLDSGEAR